MVADISNMRLDGQVAIISEVVQVLEKLLPNSSHRSEQKSQLPTAALQPGRKLSRKSEPAEELQPSLQPTLETRNRCRQWSSTLLTSMGA